MATEQHEVEQRVAGDFDKEHEHAAVVHAHDHWHVSHHRKADMLGAFEHRARHHVHEHDHGPMTHAHKGDEKTEQREHGDAAHDHDHKDPANRRGA